MGKTYNMHESAQKLCIPYQTLMYYRRTRGEKFPKPTRMGHALVWDEDELHQVWAYFYNIGYFNSPARAAAQKRREREYIEKYGE